MTLNTIEPGQHVIVEAIDGVGAFRRRLMELGVLPGTAIVRTGQAPFGDPLTFRVRGAVLCLRRREAATVRVTDSESLRVAAK